MATRRSGVRYNGLTRAALLSTCADFHGKRAGRPSATAHPWGLSPSAARAALAPASLSACPPPTPPGVVTRLAGLGSLYATEIMAVNASKPRAWRSRCIAIPPGQGGAYRRGYPTSSLVRILTERPERESVHRLDSSHGPQRPPRPL